MTSTPTHTNVSESPTALKGRALRTAKRVDVILGMAKYNCRFHGICRMEAPGLSVGEVADCDCRDTVPAWLLRRGHNSCLMYLWRDRLSPAREQYHFSRARLEVGTSLDVTAWHPPPLPGGKVYLPKGHYILHTTKNYYALQLPLRLVSYTPRGHMR